jgi:hypothetical protein
MSIRAARPGPSPGTVRPAHLRAGPARPLAWPCCVVPAHRLCRRPEPEPVVPFRAGPARISLALCVPPGCPTPALLLELSAPAHRREEAEECLVGW